MSSHWSSPRSLLRETLMPSDFFESIVETYCKNTGKSDDFYKNRVIFLDGMWGEVDNMRQCAGCGYVVLNNNKEVKLLSCGGCKRMHYCNRRCQKKHWKGAHREECGSTKYPSKIVDAFTLCMGILSMLTMTSGFKIEYPGMGTVVNMCCYMLGEIKDGDNFICNHLLECKEEGRILIPIWDSMHDALAFVAVSLDYFKFGLEDATMADTVQDYIRDENNNYCFTLCMDGHADGVFYRKITKTWARLPAHNIHGRIASGGV